MARLGGRHPRAARAVTRGCGARMRLAARRAPRGGAGGPPPARCASSGAPAWGSHHRSVSADAAAPGLSPRQHFCMLWEMHVLRAGPSGPRYAGCVLWAVQGRCRCRPRTSVAGRSGCWPESSHAHAARASARASRFSGCAGSPCHGLAEPAAGAARHVLVGGHVRCLQCQRTQGMLSVSLFFAKSLELLAVAVMQGLFTGCWRSSA